VFDVEDLHRQQRGAALITQIEDVRFCRSV
jgi:hypothetical protein